MAEDLQRRPGDSAAIAAASSQLSRSCQAMLGFRTVKRRLAAVRIMVVTSTSIVGTPGRRPMFDRPNLVPVHVRLTPQRSGRDLRPCSALATETSP
jgi:hypothetical protein